MLEIGIILALGTALTVAGILWRMAKAEAARAKKDLNSARVIATAATHISGVLAERIKNRDRQLNEIVKFIDEGLGSDGLSRLLNDELLPDSEDGDDPDGMPN